MALGVGRRWPGFPCRSGNWEQEHRRRRPAPRRRWWGWRVGAEPHDIPSLTTNVGSGCHAAIHRGRGHGARGGGYRGPTESHNAVAVQLGGRATIGGNNLGAIAVALERHGRQQDPAIQSISIALQLTAYADTQDK